MGGNLYALLAMTRWMPSQTTRLRNDDDDGKSCNCSRKHRRERRGAISVTISSKQDYVTECTENGNGGKISQYDFLRL